MERRAIISQDCEFCKADAIENYKLRLSRCVDFDINRWGLVDSFRLISRPHLLVQPCAQRTPN